MDEQMFYYNVTEYSVPTNTKLDRNLGFLRLQYTDEVGI